MRAGRDTCPPGERRRLDPEEVSEVWRDLMHGRWRVAGTTEARGRMIVALRSVAGERIEPLTRRERWAIALAARGASNKVIAFSLGIAPSTAAEVIAVARGKVGARSRRELIALFGAAATLGPGR